MGLSLELWSQSQVRRLVNVKGKGSLTEGERRLLSLLASGLSDAEIASILQKPEQDIVASFDALLSKTGTHSRLELALFALAE